MGKTFLSQGIRKIIKKGTILEVQVLYNVFHHEAVSILIPIYFYIVGLDAGCSIVSITATLLGKNEYKPVAKIGAIFAITLFSISPIFLLVDLFQPLRFWYLFLHFNPTSPISWGTYFLCAYPTFTGIYIYFLFKNNVRWSKIFGVISLPIAISVHGYTGFRVCQSPRPLEYCRHALLFSMFCHDLGDGLYACRCHRSLLHHL